MDSVSPPAKHDHDMDMDDQSPSRNDPGRAVRSKIVCVRCHKRKVRCDLQKKQNDGESECSKCVASGSVCVLRPSNRGHRSTKYRESKQTVTENNDAMEDSDYVGVETAFTKKDDTDFLDNRHSIARILLNAASPESTFNDPNFWLESNNHNHISNKSEASPQGMIKSDGHSRQSSVGILDQPLQQQQHRTHQKQPSVMANNLRESHDRLREIHNTTKGEESKSQYLGDTGFMTIFSKPTSSDSEEVAPHVIRTLELTGAFERLSDAVREGFVDTYFRYCYTYCPVLDRESMDGSETLSLLLDHAIALVGSQIRPPVVGSAGPQAYYERAKALFYSSYERNPIVCIQALCLLYWGASGPPHTFNIDTAWWWTSLAIRLAQQTGLHREPKNEIILPDQGLRRRIWWTLFARERLTGVCQGRPCMINPEDCDVSEPSVTDFPDPNSQESFIFVKWVKLCTIIGRIAIQLSRAEQNYSFPTHLSIELINWVNNLPRELQLPFASARTFPYNPDVHQLHLSYLTTVTLLHLKRSISQTLPTAYTAGIMSASCVARIFEDFLARGAIRFLPAITSWYIAIAILALLHGRRVDCLRDDADAAIKVLRTALKELKKMWQSAVMFDNGFDRLLSSSPYSSEDKKTGSSQFGGHTNASVNLFTLADLATNSEVNWLQYFPYVTSETSPLAATLLGRVEDTSFTGLGWPPEISAQLQEIFEYG